MAAMFFIKTRSRNDHFATLCQPLILHKNIRKRSTLTLVQRMTERSQWWIQALEDFVDTGLSHLAHEREADCVRFYFTNVLLQNLDTVHGHDRHAVEHSSDQTKYILPARNAMLASQSNFIFSLSHLL